jgi:hypothetical protein
VTDEAGRLVATAGAWACAGELVGARLLGAGHPGGRAKGTARPTWADPRLAEVDGIADDGRLCVRTTVVAQL